MSTINYTSFYDAYVSLIRDDKLIVGEKILQVLKMHEEIFAGTHPKYYFNSDKSMHCINFIQNNCKHSKGKKFGGKPFILSLWQKVLIEFAIGVVRREDDIRKYEQVFAVVARKNGKSTLLSALAAYFLVADGEAGPAVYCVATKRDQANIIFKEVVAMIRQSPDLSSVLTKRKTDIYYPHNMGTFESLSSDAHSLDGLNPSFAILDEVHAMKTTDIYDVMISAFGSRENQMLFMITTAGTVRDSIYDSLYLLSESILRGDNDDETFLPLIYEIDDVDEFTELDLLKKANPNMGISKAPEYLDNQLKSAMINAAFKSNFLTKHCNIRQSSKIAFFDYESVTACQVGRIDLSKFRGKYAVGGVDLSSTTDMTSGAILIPNSGKHYIKGISFLTEQGIRQNIETDNKPYDIWQQQGHIKTAGEKSINYKHLIDWFVEARDVHGIHFLSIGYDQWNASQFAEEMRDLGFNMQVVIQGAKTLSEPMKKMNVDFLEEVIRYDSPVFKMGTINTLGKYDENDNVRPIKESAQLRTDPLISGLNAYTELMRNRDDFRYVATFDNEKKYEEDNS